MKKRLLIVRQNVVLGLLVLLIIFGVTSSVLAAGARTKIIVVVPHRILFTVALPVYIAQEKGFYKENNIDVDPVFTRGGGENVQAVVSGDAQIGLGTGTLAVISRSFHSVTAAATSPPPWRGNRTVPSSWGRRTRTLR